MGFHKRETYAMWQVPYSKMGQAKRRNKRIGFSIAILLTNTAIHIYNI